MATTNPKNHVGVTFEEARHVLFDPFALTCEDNDSENEQRFVTLGMGDTAPFRFRVAPDTLLFG